MVRNKTQLAFAVLKNEDPEDVNHIESVVSYEYRRDDYWEKLEGVASGLPLNVSQVNQPISTTWGVENSQLFVEVIIISYYYSCQLNN